MQKMEGGGLGKRVVYVTSGRCEGRHEGGEGGGGQCPTKNPKVLLVQELETVTLERQRVNTARCSVDSRLTNTKFVSYNDWVPPNSRLPDVTHVTLSPRPRREQPGNEANHYPLVPKYPPTGV